MCFWRSTLPANSFFVKYMLDSLSVEHWRPVYYAGRRLVGCSKKGFLSLCIGFALSEDDERRVGLSKSINVRILSAQIKDTSSTAYGFTTGISDKKGSFKIGVLMADLKATLGLVIEKRFQKAVCALADGLSKLNLAHLFH